MAALISDFTQYRHVRGTAKALVSKISKAGHQLNFSLISAAQKMGLPIEGKTLFFDGEEEMAALMDFYLHEYKPRDKSLVEAFGGEDLTPEEQQMLSAQRQARASLFLAVRANENVSQVVLRDILHVHEPDCVITDISLSASVARHGELLLYTRVLTCSGTTMTCGNFFVFPTSALDQLRKGHVMRTQGLPEGARAEATYIFFYEWNRRIGEDRRYQNVG